MNALAALIIWFATWPFLALWRAYVILILWGWFIVPLVAIPAPSMYATYGAVMTLHLILPFHRAPKSDDKKSPIESVIDGVIIYGLLGPAIVLACGWIWKWLQWGVA